MKMKKIEPEVSNLDTVDSEDLAELPDYPVDAPGGPASDQEITPLVNMLVGLRDRNIQKARIAMGNRIQAVEQGRDQMTPKQLALVQDLYDRLSDLEKEIEGALRLAIKDIPEVDALRRIKGVGPIIAAELYSMIDVTKADTVSALWRYAGMGVAPDGKAERRVKGEKNHYNSTLRVVCFKLGRSFLMTGSPYSRVYADAKAYYQANRHDWTPMHIEQAAKRKMVKIFLCHLYVTFRKMKGLTVRSLYVEEKLAHTHILRPETFGWPSFDDPQPVPAAA